MMNRKINLQLINEYERFIHRQLAVHEIAIAKLQNPAIIPG